MAGASRDRTTTSAHCIYLRTTGSDYAQRFIGGLDLTKVWPHSEFPLRPIGKMVLNENPVNYFAEVEQV